MDAFNDKARAAIDGNLQPGWTADYVTDDEVTLRYYGRFVGTLEPLDGTAVVDYNPALLGSRVDRHVEYVKAEVRRLQDLVIAGLYPVATFR